MRCASATPCGMAPATKPRHSTAPLGFPGSARTRAPSTIAARLRERMELGVSFIDSARITSPNPGTSTRMIARIASGVTSRGPMPVPPVVRIKPQPCCAKDRIVSWMRLASSGTTASQRTCQSDFAATFLNAGPPKSSYSPPLARSEIVIIPTVMFTALSF